MMAVVGENDGDLSGDDGAEGQWSFDESLDGLEDSIVVGDDAPAVDLPAAPAPAPAPAPVSGRSVPSAPAMTAAAGDGAGVPQMGSENFGTECTGSDGWDDDDLGLISDEEDHQRQAPNVPQLQHMHDAPSTTDATAHTTTSSTFPIPPAPVAAAKAIAASPAPSQPLPPSMPTDKTASTLLGSGLLRLGAGISATVTALAEPDDDDDDDEDNAMSENVGDGNGGWEGDDEDFSFGSDEERDMGAAVEKDVSHNDDDDKVPTFDQQSTQVLVAQSSIPSAEAAKMTPTSDIAAPNAAYQTPPPPPFPTAASILPAASRWGAAIAGAVAPATGSTVQSEMHVGGNAALDRQTALQGEDVAHAGRGSSDTVHVGGHGPFLGRLTRFIEDAAAPTDFVPSTERVSSVDGCGENKTEESASEVLDGEVDGWHDDGEDFNFDDSNDEKESLIASGNNDVARNTANPLCAPLPEPVKKMMTPERRGERETLQSAPAEGAEESNDSSKTNDNASAGFSSGIVDPGIVCGSPCEAAKRGEVCQCIQFIFSENGTQTDSEVSKLLQSETARRVLLERKAEADEDAIETLMKKNDELSQALGKESQQLRTMLGEQSKEKEDREASQRMSFLAFEEEKRVWAEQTAALEDEVQALREQIEIAGQSTEKANELSAEVATLRYELECKTTECNDLQTKLESDHHDLRGEVRSLRSKISQLEADQAQMIAEKSAEMSRVLNEKGILVEQSAAKVSNLEEELKEAGKRSDVLAQEADLKRNEVEALRTERDHLLSDLSTRDEACTSFELEVKRVKSLHERVRNERDEIAEKLETSIKQDLDKVSRLKELENMNILLIQEKKALEIELLRSSSTAQETSDANAAKLSATFQEKVDLEVQLEELRKALETSSNEQDDTLLKLKEEEQRFLGLRDEMNSLRREMATKSDESVLLTSTDTGGEIEKIRDEYRDLSFRCQELEADVDRMQAEATMNEAEVAALESEMEELASQRDVLQARVDDLSGDDQENERERTQRERLLKLQLENSSLNDQNRELSSEKELLAEKISAQGSEIRQLQISRDQLIDDNEGISGERSELSTEIELMKRSMVEKESKIRSLQIELEKNNCTLQENSQNDSEITQLKATIDSLRDDVAMASRERDAAELRADDIAKKKEAIDISLRDCVSELSSIRDERDKLQSTIATLEESNERTIQERDECISNLREELKKARNQYDSQNADLGTKTEELSAKLLEKETNITELIERINELEEKTSSHPLRLRELETRAKDNENALSDELSAAHASIESLEAQVRASNDEVRQLEVENEELFVELGLLRQLHEEERGRFETKLACENGAAYSPSQSVLAKVEELEKKCSEKDDLIGNMKEELRSLRHDVNLGREEENAAVALVGDLDIKISELERCLEEKNDEIQRLNSQLARGRPSNVPSRGNQKSSTEENEDDGKAALKNLIAAKGEELCASKRELKQLRAEMEICRKELAESQKEIDRFSSMSGNISSSLFEISSKDAAESVEFMRDQIISLAMAVENVESRRAYVLDQLADERKSNAESVRKLGDSVKRFYSSLVCMD